MSIRKGELTKKATIDAHFFLQLWVWQRQHIVAYAEEVHKMWVQLLEGLQNAGRLCRWREGMAQRFQQQHPPCSMDLPDTHDKTRQFSRGSTHVNERCSAWLPFLFSLFPPFLFLDTQSKGLLVLLLPLNMQGAHNPAVGQEISIRLIYLLCCAHICYWKNCPSSGMVVSPPARNCEDIRKKYIQKVSQTAKR